MSSGAADAVAALKDAARDAWNDSFAAGQFVARAHTTCVKSTDLVEMLRAGIDLLVALTELHDKTEAAVKAMRETLSTVMADTGATTVQATHHSAHLARRAAVLVVDEAMVPQQFIVQRPTVDRAAIKTAIKDGIAVPGASMLQPNDQILVLRARKELVSS